mgnify:CR=1 FL=1
MIVGVLKEAAPETRVSLIAEGAAQLVKKNSSVWIESGAGMNAYCFILFDVLVINLWTIINVGE